MIARKTCHDELLAQPCNMIVDGELLPNRGTSVACSKLAAQWNEAIDHHEDILMALYRRDGAVMPVRKVEPLCRPGPAIHICWEWTFAGVQKTPFERPIWFGVLKP
jgi:hypothetical protein